jgi:hypothetical protein
LPVSACDLNFYQGLLGLNPDERRPNIPCVPGFCINVGDVGQIHLMGGQQPSPFAKGEGQVATFQGDMSRLGEPSLPMAGV